MADVHLRIGFYNLGLAETALIGSHCKEHLTRIGDELADAWSTSRLHLLCLCEIGEHIAGLATNEWTMFKDMLEQRLPQLHKVHRTGSYVTIERRPASATERGVSVSTRDVEDIDSFHPTQPDRHAQRIRLCLQGEREGTHEIVIINVHFPSSSKWKLTTAAREAMLTLLMQNAGGSPGVTPTNPWIMGGDFNTVTDRVKDLIAKWQPRLLLRICTHKVGTRQN